MPLGVGIAVATSKSVGTLTSKPASAAVVVVEVNLRICHGEVARKVGMKAANGRRNLIMLQLNIH